MKNWYGLMDTGAIVFLGRATSFHDAADLPKAATAIWIIGEDGLDRWDGQIAEARQEARDAAPSTWIYRAVVIDEEFCYQFKFVEVFEGNGEGFVRQTLTDQGHFPVAVELWTGEDPLQEEINDLVGWALTREARGEDWREALALAWATGNYRQVGAGDGTAASLQRLRNTLGYGPGSEFIRTLDVSSYGD
jgi:hypothetical protein